MENEGSMSPGCEIDAKTYSNGGIKLFGVHIEGPTRQEPMNPLIKSASTGNLLEAYVMNDGENNDRSEKNVHDPVEDGYLSEGHVGPTRNRMARGRKKGMPWTEEEHKCFLAGLETLGKGDWRGISKKYVLTRTPTQVASHAQKFFLRQQAASGKKRRPSVFDMKLEAEAGSSSQNAENTEIPMASLQVSKTSPTRPKTEIERQSRALTADKMINRFPHLCLDNNPLMNPGFRVPTYYPEVPCVRIPVMDFSKHMGYQFMPTTIAANCVPVCIHPSGIPCPGLPNRNFQDGRSHPH